VLRFVSSQYSDLIQTIQRSFDLVEHEGCSVRGTRRIYRAFGTSKCLCSVLHKNLQAHPSISISIHNFRKLTRSRLAYDTSQIVKRLGNIYSLARYVCITMNTSGGMLWLMAVSGIAACMLASPVDAFQSGPDPCPSTTPAPSGTNKCPLKLPTDPEFGDICHPGATGYVHLCCVLCAAFSTVTPASTSSSPS
jgi:hypothetical protein